MHHGMCVTHMPCCMLGSLTRGGVENVPGIPGACATRNFTYLARGPWWCHGHGLCITDPLCRESTRALSHDDVMTWIGYSLCITVPLCRESTSNWGITSLKSAELWWFLLLFAWIDFCNNFIGWRILINWGGVMHICVIKISHHWFRYWLVACLAPSHYLNQCWLIVNWALRNKVQWNFNRYSNIFIQKHAYENLVSKMAAILSQP